MQVGGPRDWVAYIPEVRTLGRKNSILEIRMKGQNPIIQMIKQQHPTVLMTSSTWARLRFGKKRLINYRFLKFCIVSLCMVEMLLATIARQKKAVLGRTKILVYWHKSMIIPESI